MYKNANINLFLVISNHSYNIIMMSKIFDGMKLRLCRAANQHFIIRKLRYLPLDHNLFIYIS